MEIIRYDGTRFITEEEIDREFTGQWVLISTDRINAHEGYLIASVADKGDLWSEVEDIGIEEFGGKAKIIYGCATRGSSLHVELLG